MWTYMLKPTGDTEYLPSSVTLCMSRQGLLLNLDLTDCLVSQYALEIPYVDVPRAGITDQLPYLPGIYLGAEDLISVPETYVMSALHAEPSI